MGGRVIGGVAVADEFESIVFGKGSDGFGEGDERIAGSTVIRDVIGMDGTGCGADGEPCIIPSIHNADIRFITGDYGVKWAFIVHVEFVAEDGGSVGVIEDGLMRDGYLKDILEHMSRHSSAMSIRDVQGQNETESVETTVNTVYTALIRSLRGGGH